MMRSIFGLSMFCIQYFATRYFAYSLFCNFDILSHRYFAFSILCNFDVLSFDNEVLDTLRFDVWRSDVFIEAFSQNAQMEAFSQNASKFQQGMLWVDQHNLYRKYKTKQKLINLLKNCC